MGCGASASPISVTLGEKESEKKNGMKVLLQPEEPAGSESYQKGT